MLFCLCHHQGPKYLCHFYHSIHRNSHCHQSLTLRAFLNFSLIHPGQSEELTLMQKLAQLSMVQRGTDITPATKLDPKTGATLITADDSRLIYNQMFVGRSKVLEHVKTGDLAKKPSTTSSGTGPDPATHAASQTQGDFKHFSSIPVFLIFFLFFSSICH